MLRKIGIGMADGINGEMNMKEDSKNSMHMQKN